MQYIPENLTKPHRPSIHEVNHERRQLKWFMIICLLLLLLTGGTNVILGLYGQSSIPPKDDPMVQATPTVTLPSPSPTIVLSPPSSATKSSTPNTCASYRVNGKTVNACATCGNKVCEAYETCTPSISGSGVATDDCGKLYCPVDCEKASPSPTAIPTKAASKPNDQTMCPMDAKVCPDGKTYVGRTGPNCEFAPCPK